MLVNRGTLNVGDSIVAGDALRPRPGDARRERQAGAVAGPARPVQVLGLTAVPGAGDTFLAVAEDRTARQIAEQRQARERAAQMANRGGRVTLENLLERIKEGERTTLTLILKGDVSGSVEALEDALVKIEVADEVQLKIIHRGVGGVTQDDVNLASASDAIIIGFNVRAEGKVREYADREGVEIRYYTVIYQAIEEVESALKGMLKPEFEEVELGTAEVREVFRSSKIGNIAGCIVRSGIIRRNAKARLLRDGAVVAENLTITVAQAVQGRRHRGPRGLRVRSDARQLQRHPGRRHHRDVRDAGEAPRLGEQQDPRTASRSGGPAIPAIPAIPARPTRPQSVDHGVT